jgi:spoIIIJ-associated protein
MSQNRTSLEIIAPTIDEAISKGLTELGLSRDRVEVDVLDEGNRGLFGIGTRQARIRLSILEPDEVQPTQTAYEAPPPPPLPPVVEKPAVVEEQATPAEEPVSQHDEVEISADDNDVMELATATVEELLERMGVQAQVDTSIADQEDNRGRRPVLVNITGSDLSILIGRQTETLNALQYITTLIVGKELGRAVSLVVDVEGYRQRREQQLRQLARRMADQAIKTGRRQVLEPMPANERRIIHMELREIPEVETESVGEDPRRKVTILPK